MGAKHTPPTAMHIPFWQLNQHGNCQPLSPLVRIATATTNPPASDEALVTQPSPLKVTPSSCIINSPLAPCLPPQSLLPNHQRHWFLLHKGTPLSFCLFTLPALFQFTAEISRFHHQEEQRALTEQEQNHRVICKEQLASWLQEDSIWKQRARITWLQEGDLNSLFSWVLEEIHICATEGWTPAERRTGNCI